MFLDWQDPNSWQPMLSLLHPTDRALPKFWSAFEQCYEGVVGYHGCRTTDVNEYYRDGLRVADHARTDELARSFFVSNQFPGTTREKVELAIQRIDGFKAPGERRIDDGKCYLALDERSLLRTCGHYMIYGSERILAIANHLGGTNYKDVLKLRGMPTVVVVNLPTRFLTNDLRPNLARKIRQCIVVPYECTVLYITEGCCKLPVVCRRDSWAHRRTLHRCSGPFRTPSAAHES